MERDIPPIEIIKDRNPNDDVHLPIVIPMKKTTKFSLNNVYTKISQD